jgi:hypothetical protein
MIYALVLIFAVLLYAQIIIVRGFNTEVFASNGYSIILKPESRQEFGGLSWGLLRFDLEDKLYVGVSAHIGADRDAIIRLEKAGKTLVVRCKSDDTGICYEAFHRDDMKMSGNFMITIDDGVLPSRTYKGRFSRRSRPVLLLKEILLSV